jgi:chloramphenicol-sensitive protein RarD
MNAKRSQAPTPAPDTAASPERVGYVYGIAAYLLWGIIPIYFKQLSAAPSLDIVAHRILWSLPLLVVLLFIARAWPQVAAALRNPRTLALLVVTSVLIGVNWLFYVYAVTNGHILAGSLGYYLNPLANILLGRFILGEQLTRRQWAAVGIAAAGVAVLAAGALDTLWISLVLCFSFGTYGLLRKIVQVDALAGLSIETGLLFPVAFIWLFLGGMAGFGIFGQPGILTPLLMAAGVISTVPLLLFTAAARRLPYSTVGMLQFLAPTLQFIVAVFIYGEALTTAHLVAFAAIWIALTLYVSSILRERRRTKNCPELGEG